MKNTCFFFFQNEQKCSEKIWSGRGRNISKVFTNNGGYSCLIPCQKCARGRFFETGGDVESVIHTAICGSGSWAHRVPGVQLITPGLPKLFISCHIKICWPTWRFEGIFYQDVILYRFTGSSRTSETSACFIMQYRNQVLGDRVCP